MITLQDIQNHPVIAELVEAANRNLAAMGYTEHGRRHVGYVSHTTAEILRQLGYPPRTVELAEITGWVHDVGNALARHNHGVTGASLLLPVLREVGMDMSEISRILSAVGNHEEQYGRPVSEISAALIIADKSDAHRTRVRRKRFSPDDIHDRVNYSIKKNWVSVDTAKKQIHYVIVMDDTSSVMEFFEIFMSRMKMCEEAAQFLDCQFCFLVNDVVIFNGRKVGAR